MVCVQARAVSLHQAGLSMGNVIGLILVHVDDFQITGDYDIPEFRAEYEHLQKLYRWGTWKSDVEGYSMCGVEVSRTVSYTHLTLPTKRIV